jgi:uncharacterized protein
VTAIGRESGAESRLVSVRVHPSARRAKIEKLGPREYKVHVTAPPEKGRANREVLEALASHLGIPVSRLRLVRGAASRIKIVAVEGDTD